MDIMVIVEIDEVIKVIYKIGINMRENESYGSLVAVMNILEKCRGSFSGRMICRNYGFIPNIHFHEKRI